MLWCYQQLAAHLEAEGARVLRSDAVGPVPRSGTGGSGGRSVWWHGAVAVVTDGHSLLADDGLDLGEEWLFTVGRPDLVVADRGFAAAAAAAGHETIACADLDAVALEVAARQGLAIVVVPVDDCCAPAAYSSLVERLTQPVAVPAARPVPGGPGGGGESHSTTPAPGAYAAP